jgi:DNA adenine methylase
VEKRMKIPQPFQYQGSKRALAVKILGCFPSNVARVVEPFAGSAALSIACAARKQAGSFWLNDYNQPLAALLDRIIQMPEAVAESYKRIWRDDPDAALLHYYRVRDDFNRTHDPLLLLYLLARCVKGSVRYNADGLFNQSPDKRRLGTRPDTLRGNLLAVSALLRGRAKVTACQYQAVLEGCDSSDVVYMDPPYQGVCGERDGRYLSRVDFDEFVSSLERLNDRGIRFILSYDGKLGHRSYGKALPDGLDLTRIELDAGRSSQATLLGRQETTVESLYLSRQIADELKLRPARRVVRQTTCQTPLFA